MSFVDGHDARHFEDELASLRRAMAAATDDNKVRVYENGCREIVRYSEMGRLPKPDVVDGLMQTGIDGGMRHAAIQPILSAAFANPMDLSRKRRAAHVSTNGGALTPASDDIPANKSVARPELVRVSEVDPTPVEWLWVGRLARGKVTLNGGDPGLGKTQVGLDILARISVGSEWPDGGTAPRGRVIVLSAEDGVADTIRPRLEASGANLDHVYVLTAMKEPNGSHRPFSLQADLAALEDAINQFGDVRAVMIDPLTAYMGNIDSHRTTDVRAVLDPLSHFAERTGVAVLAITHPPKASQAKAIHAFTGSLAFVAAARMAFMIVEEEGTERVLMLPVKNNLAPLPKGLGFHKVQRMTTGAIVASHIVWDSAPVTVTAGEAMRASAQSGKDGSDLADAVDFLRERLSYGPMPANDVKAAADAEGISGATLRRARAKLGVVAEKGGFKEGWSWRLP
jgi:hypothetical protein